MAFFEGNNMTGGYGKGPDIINSCTVNVERGEIVSILGPNGAGKSTAMKAMLGLLNLKSVSVNDFDIIASTNHCIGPFEAECSTIEVFELGQLNEGEYSFKIYSSHGNYFYESESDTVCTPGIIPSSIDSTSFFVMSQMNLEQHQEKLFDSDFIMIDVLGREHIEHKRGTLLFHIYDNGVVEKKFTP